jgi:transposase
MGKYTKKTCFVGIDISKSTIDTALLTGQEKGKASGHKFSNDIKGFEEMREWLRKSTIQFSDCLFCMEHTGTYGLLLFAWLSHQGIDFCVVPGLEIKRSLGMTRGKNDLIDAVRIAKYAQLKKSDLIPFVLPSERLLQIKQRLTYRDQLVKMRTGLKNSLNSHLEYQKINSDDFVSKDIIQQIDNISRSISQIESQIIQIIEDEEKLKENYLLVTSVKGIGLVIAAFMLVTTNNFSSFENGRKFACYAGIAPFPYESGTSIKGKSKVSHLANKKMKTLFANGANSAKSWDPEMKNYYKRKIDEGKAHKAVINAISCKLVNRVFAVVKRRTPYVSTYQQIF